MKTNRKLFLPLVAAIALALGGNALAADSSSAEDISDARREAQIWTSYAFNPHLKALALEVEVNGDQAVITGTVEEGIDKSLAEQIALGVDGIARVDNKIVVDSAYVPKPRPAGTERDFTTTVEDATITAAVKSKLLWNTHTDGLEIDVDTQYGKVTLNGTADTAEAKDIAGRLARNTDDVVAVDNKLTLDPKVNVAKAGAETATTDQPVADSWITTKIKATYTYSRWVDGSDIMVDTIEGIVKLSGSVESAAEKDLAVELAQNIRGVKKVDASGLKVG